MNNFKLLYGFEIPYKSLNTLNYKNLKIFFLFKKLTHHISIS
jgi:hypothetical protein